MKIRSALLLFALAATQAAAAAPAAGREPDCSGAEHWPAAITFVKLKNAGIVTNASVDFPHVQSRRLTSQRIGRDLWRQVHRVTIPLRRGGAISALAISDASSDECSMGDVQVYIISRKL